MRQAFVRALCEEAKKNKKIFLVTGDLGFNILEPFQAAYPKRFLNVGVAESNLITVAGGLATTGFIPFVYSIASFVSMRPFEQIRNNISWQNLNVKIIGVGGGLTYAKAGPTHHSMEDISLMRNFSNMTIISPKDPREAYLATKQIINHAGPVYMRFERNPETTDYFGKTFQIGKGQRIRQGKEMAIIATGVQVYSAVKVASMLEKNDINASVYSFSTIQPLDIKLLNSIMNNYNTIVTLEEHRIGGGLGTAIEEFSYSRNFKKQIKIIKLGLNNSFSPFSASYSNLLDFHGLSPAKIKKTILENVKNG